MTPTLRDIPSVSRVLRELGDTGLPRPVVVAAVRDELATLRNAHRAGRPPQGDPIDRIRHALATLRRSRLQPVINGAGVVIHTNLGRSPLSPAAADAIAAAATAYTNLEFDLATGARGSRAAYLESALALLCGTEAATVVNNCAAALVLTLRHLVRPERDQAIVSRGELVQIGGGFRVPEILEASGAALREVGTTNHTTLRDYGRAVTPHTALLLHVHRSNFYMDGFVESPPLADLARLAHQHHLPLVADLGTGATFDTRPLGGDEAEPTPAETIAAGADYACFSGDKLLGGPQAGIIAGSRQRIAALKQDPFFRALRCDKLVLAGLEATVTAHLAGDAAALPILAMMRLTTDDLRPRAERLASSLGGEAAGVTVGRGESRVGGGTLPRTAIPTVTLDLRPPGRTPQQAADALRAGTPPVIGYIAGDTFRLDLRTVFPEQDTALAAALRPLLTP